MRLKLNICETLIEYILALLIILSCNSVFLYSINKNYHIPELIIVFTGLLACFLSYNSKFNKRCFQSLIITLIIYIIYIFIFVLLNPFNSSRINFIIKFAIFIPLMTYCFFAYKQKNIPHQIFYRISDLILILSVISILFWIFGTVANKINPTGYFYVYWGNERNISSYYNIYFETQTISFLNYKGLRNSGIFCEAAMYSLCLVVALVIELFLKENTSFKKCLVFLVTIVTTFSTTGFISAIMVIVIKIFILKSNNSIKILKKLLTLGFMGLGIYVIFAILNLKQQTTSYSTRIDDFIAGYKSWVESPILGNGYGSIDPIRKYMSNWRSYNVGFSNGIMAVLAQGGIMLIIVYIIPFVFYFKKSIKLKRLNLFFVGITILELFITTFWQDTFLLFTFMAFGYSLFLQENNKYRISYKV